MSARIASTVSIGLLAGLSCLLTGFAVEVPIWALFIAWAAFFAAGGGLAGAKRSLLMNVIGVASASATVLAIGALGGSTWAVAGCVVVGAGVLVLVTNGGLLSFTPAGFFGFASLVGTIDATGSAIADPVTMSHPVVLVVGAILLGTAFGIVSEWLGTSLTSKEVAPAA
ncbi:DUF1097 domain-containing protein [Mycolicibacterium baixiangningiae]|uniref:DUF1097 domain-containing protein n=1 Tax=Mycolicibacterium baixiangningiae TaxID=2761578 RepID=UPI00186775CB|nr:DUF1097 domain-containing protein [Mycolicibacterium baixiangningiae]